jgi:potassium inwardly-rectifying channel subfamily J
VTSEGEKLPFYQQELPLSADGCDGRLMFIWPTLLIHKIDEKSPLYGVRAEDDFEIVVMIEGAVETTGLATQARSSYLSSEVLWNHRFESMVEYSKEKGKFEVGSFHLVLI